MEYEKNTQDITGILQILNMLTQNINISVESIKSNIQQSNAEAIETSAEDFKKFILDLVDIMKSVEEIGEDSAQTTETTEMVGSIMGTLKLFTDNADSTIGQLIERVKESADVEIQASTTNFDTFVQDLMEILEDVYLSLRKLTMSKSQELYKQLDEISENINSQTDDLNLTDKRLTEANIQQKHDSENLSAFNQRLEEISKRNQEIKERSTKVEEEINERKANINERENQIKDVDAEITKLEDLKDAYWQNISKIQGDIENAQAELEKLRTDLQELHGIQSLFENLTEIDESVKI